MVLKRSNTQIKLIENDSQWICAVKAAFKHVGEKSLFDNWDFGATQFVVDRYPRKKGNHLFVSVAPKLKNVNKK